MAGEAIMISCAHMRPPPTFGSNCWVSTACQVIGKHDADLFLLCHREDIDDAVYGLRGAVGMHGGEDQVAGFRRVNGQVHRFQVAHLADEEDIRVFA